MKYNPKNFIIPKERRALINEKILSLLEANNLQNVTSEEIFNGYTGDGGLHNLSIKDFDNFHEYSEAKKEIEQGQFFTPGSIAGRMLSLVRPGKHDLIADLCCGTGVFFNFAAEEANVYGCDVDLKAIKVAKHLYPLANIECKDIRFYNPGIKFDYVFGNPPFNLKWTVEGEECLSQMFYCTKAFELLKPGGILCVITPLHFLADSFSDKTAIAKIEEHYNFIVQYENNADSFKHLGVNYFETKVIILQKKSEALKEVPFRTELAQEPYEDLYSKYIFPVLEEKEKLKSKFLQEISRSENSKNWSFKNRLLNENDGFDFQLKKMLYEVKSHPSINSYYGKCLDYIQRWKTQEKPAEMDWKDWEKSRITENKVLAYLKRIINKQNRQDLDKIELVKTNYGLKFKAYSDTSAKRLSEVYKQSYYSFNDLVINYPVRIPVLEPENYISLTDNLIRRKRDQYLIQSKSFRKMERSASIDKFLNDFSFLGRGEKPANFNLIQKYDLGLVLQKKYSQLNWQQGSGKTAASYACSKFWANNVSNTFIIAPALAINLTWETFLKLHNESYVKLERFSDIDKISPGQYVLVSLSMISKLKKQIQKFIKIKSQKVGLIFDESDEITNHNSAKTKSVLACFRRVKFKLNATGTTTRNNINEFYSQLELLYNNSINMICNCPKIYKEEYVKEEGLILRERTNKFYGKPFPAYFGFGTFKGSFAPSKSSVFGVQKNNQDIYHQSELLGLIEKTVITRKFKEIAGPDRYKIINHRVKQSFAEQEIYKVIIEEFYTLAPLFYASTGSSRKDAMLRIIQQINLLIKATSLPHQFPNYSSEALPSKFIKIIEMVKNFDEKVAIGCTTLSASNQYYEVLKENFPEREIFLIQGDVSFVKRKDIIKEFEKTSNGILVSTQQSLKSSVNIPTCSKVIIESLQWNIPKMEQYFFRFIRYDSIAPAEVHIITYGNTIEQNILALLMAKERINDFIKSLEYKEQAEIFEEYQVDMDILQTIIRKERDEEGKVNLKWGYQKVS